MPEDENAAADALSKAASAAASLESVTIGNSTRTGLTFRVPGKSLHLAPGQVLDLPKAYLDTPELKALCRQGAISEIPPKPNAGKNRAAPEGEGGPQAPPAAEDGTGRSSFRRR